LTAASNVVAPQDSFGQEGHSQMHSSGDLLLLHLFLYAAFSATEYVSAAELISAGKV
jgi:hypothetical protein